MNTPDARPWYQQAAAAQGGILTAPYADAGGAGLVVGAAGGRPVVTRCCCR